MRKGILEELNKSGISVTDMANQSWCEYKVYLSCIEKEKPTKAMEKGTMIHRKLQKEVYKELVVEPVTYPDVFYKNAYENIMTLKSLVENGKGRELKISGEIDGFTIRGQVDELMLQGEETVIIENKTSRNENHKEMYGDVHSVQVMLYRLMFDDIISKRFTFKKYYDSNSVYRMKLSPQFIEGLRGIGIKDELIGIGTICSNMFDAFYSIPKMSDRLMIRYMDQGGGFIDEVEVNYDRQRLMKIIEKDMGFWKKEREPEPVRKEESWKCRHCYFLNKCKFGLSYV